MSEFSYFGRWMQDLDLPFLSYENRIWTRRAFLREVGCAAGSLRRLGVGRGERVALVLENSPQLLFSIFAVHSLGAVAVPINPRYSEVERSYILKDAQPALALSETAPATCPGIPSLALADMSMEKVAPRGSEAAGINEVSEIPRNPDDPAFLFYTSGTTSRPKGVVLSHRNVMACLESLRQAWCWRSDDRLLLALPLFHVHGLIVATCGSVWNGSEIVLRRAFDSSAVLDDLKRCRCSLFMGVPTMYQRLLERGRELLVADAPEEGAPAALTASVRLLISGSAPLPAVTHRDFARLFGHHILERYGMTETLMVLSNPCQGKRKPGSVGVPLPGVDVRLADERGGEPALGEIGELWVRGDTVFREYWNNPDATQAVFADGWFRTGDMARQDEDGYFFIAGRKSVDIIKCYGFKISALEVESVLLELPGVEEAAVLGVADSDKGEVVVAFVRPRSRKGGDSWEGVETDAAGLASLIQADVEAFLESRLARYKQPSRYRLVQELPRNAMGKVNKAELRAGAGKKN